MSKVGEALIGMWNSHSMRMDLMKRLAAKSILQKSGCIEWQGNLDGQGYGLTSVGNRNMRVHRLSWCFANGKLPTQHVCHTCDNPKCINPEHLFEGTVADNMRDKTSKGRNNALMGENVHGNRLSEKDVVSIFKRLMEGERPTKIAREFSVGRQTVQHIKYGTTWGWLTNPIRCAYMEGK